jgi:hypothetical protein
LASSIHQTSTNEWKEYQQNLPQWHIVSLKPINQLVWPFRGSGSAILFSSSKMPWDSINGKERTWKVAHTSGVHCFHLVFMNYD